MSIKLFNGFRLPKMSLSQLNEWCMEFRSKIDVVNQELINIYVADTCTNLIDAVFLFSEKEFYNIFKAYSVQSDTSAYWAVNSMIFERQAEIRRTKTRDPEVDYSCQLVLFPAKNKILGLYYTEKKEHINILSNMPYAKEYAYWDNTDKPENISVKQWNLRRETWNKTLDFSGSPTFKGFIVKCQEPLIPFPNEIIPYIPSLEERAETQAENILFQTKFAELLKETPDNWVLAYRHAHKWLSENSNLISQKSSNISPLLRPKLTAEDYYTNFEDIFVFKN